MKAKIRKNTIFYSFKKPFFDNRLIDTCAKTLLIYALIHTLTMIIYATITGNVQILNGFRILGISLFFHYLEVGVNSFIIGTFILFSVFILVYCYLARK